MSEGCGGGGGGGEGAGEGGEGGLGLGGRGEGGGRGGGEGGGGLGGGLGLGEGGSGLGGGGGGGADTKVMTGSSRYSTAGATFKYSLNRPQSAAGSVGGFCALRMHSCCQEGVRVTRTAFHLAQGRGRSMGAGRL
jgi:hypothetical protein